MTSNCKSHQAAVDLNAMDIVRHLLSQLHDSKSEGIMKSDQGNANRVDDNSYSPLNVTVINDERVACNGGGGPLGHPQVWLNIGTEGRIVCPYCSREFVKSTD
ncbi:zinc-finger domain-containing protein [Candidatus Puniceispirillum sp.]|nr:zinc-finger domain-containing protein [Candidatus Puniceispirillum sp.]